MTAGSGIMHEEMPQLRGGRLAGFQLWVNLPARQKMTQPRYQEFTAVEIPEVTREDGSKIKVIAGVFGNVRGPVAGVAADPTYLDFSLPANTSVKHAIARGQTAFAYLFEGDGVFAGKHVDAPNLIIFDDGDSVEIAAGDSSIRFLLISGKPLGEPIARYGPFVMNTPDEIRQAIRDLAAGTFVKSQATTR
jgi:redox-sensitive bicupin YhaK (pirin superfamily)